MASLENNAQPFDCLIIHGCPDDYERALDPERRTYDKHWLPWLKRELLGRGLRAETPLLPEPWAPRYEAFKAEFEKYPISENTILVGHSCGGSFLARYLGETKRRAKALVIVAPWKQTKYPDDQIRNTFYGYEVDAGIKERVKDIIMFTADNEDPIGKISLDVFHQALGGEVIELPGRGHYIYGDMGREEFPELLEKIIEIWKRN